MPGLPFVRLFYVSVNAQGQLDVAMPCQRYPAISGLTPARSRLVINRCRHPRSPKAAVLWGIWAGSSAASASFRPAYKIEFHLGGKKRKTGMHFVEMGRFRRENQGVLAVFGRFAPRQLTPTRSTLRY